MGRLPPERSAIYAIALTGVALVCFASNSILCRLALGGASPDPVGFTAVRLVAGGLLLAVLFPRSLYSPRRESLGTGALLTSYALFFSLAYTNLTAGTGALLLFGSVQLTMVAWSLVSGQRVGLVSALGLGAAMFGLVWLVLPGVRQPPLAAAAAMCLAGASWGAYSLVGKRIGDAKGETARAFAVASVLIGVFWLVCQPGYRLTEREACLAVISGALTSGLGYVIWYSALGLISTITASAVQLTVPTLAAIFGVMLLGESFSPRIALCSALILGGVGLVVWQNARKRA